MAASLFVTVDAHALRPFKDEDEDFPHIISASHCSKSMQNEVNEAMAEIKKKENLMKFLLTNAFLNDMKFYLLD